MRASRYTAFIMNYILIVGFRVTIAQKKHPTKIECKGTAFSKNILDTYLFSLEY